MPYQRLRIGHLVEKFAGLEPVCAATARLLLRLLRCIQPREGGYWVQLSPYHAHEVGFSISLQHLSRVKLLHKRHIQGA